MGSFSCTLCCAGAVCDGARAAKQDNLPRGSYRNVVEQGHFRAVVGDFPEQLVLPLHGEALSGRAVDHRTIVARAVEADREAGVFRRAID
jgi:hypothetical protein